MKQRVLNSLLGALCCFAFVACNRDMIADDDAIFRTSANTGTVYMQDFTPDRNAAVGTVVMLTDKRDQNVYRCIKMADGRWWMGENLKYDIEGSVFYNNDSTNLGAYGRLYKWQEALDAAPQNWNVPSDDEWKVLEMALGMTQADADAAAVWRSSGNVGTQLKANGSSGMNMPLSGYQHLNGTYFYLDTYGRYWTSTESGATAWDRDVSAKAGVYRSTYSKAYRYAVRCVLQVREITQYMQDFVPNPADTVGTEVMLTDKRDNQVYRCIKMADGRWWMGENLKYDVAGSTFYNNDVANLATYGRLYRVSEAFDAAPENWSIPSDDEWMALETALGMPSGELNNSGSWRGASQGVGTKLKQGGESGLNLLLGGYEDNGINFDLGSYGYYWTSTEGVSLYAWVRLLSSSNTGVFRGIDNKANRLSVRYILNQ